jgi:hypothetical protein
MLHACLYTICVVFCYTSWCFYAFSRTNLLTRCHSASSMFSAVFVFQKSYTGNILGIGRNKSWTSYFYQSFGKTEDEMEGGQEPGSPQGGAAQPLAAPPVVTLHTTACCSIQVIDITLVKYQFTNITSLRVVQQKHSVLYSSTKYYKP